MRAAAGGGASEAVVHGAVVVVLGRRSCEDESTTPQWETTINIGPEDTGGRVRQRQVEDQSAVLPNDDATAVAADNNVAVCPEDHAALPPSCWLKCCYSCGQGMLECLMLLIRHGLSTCDYLHGISSTSIYWAQVLHMVYLAHPSTCHLLAFFLSGIGCNLLFVTRCHRRNEILPKFFWLSRLLTSYDIHNGSLYSRPSSACESVICKHYATMTLRLFMRSHPLKTTIKLRRCLNKLVGKGSELSKEFKRKLSPCCESLDSDGYCGQQGESSAELLYTVCDNSNRFFYWDDKHPTHAGWEAVMKQLEKPLREFVNQA